MTTLVNGCNVDQVSVNDRGLMYGQCVFETIAVNKGKPCLLDAHLDRLCKGAKVIGIGVDRIAVINDVTSLASPLSRGIVRVNLTMGEGGRGYQNPDQPKTTRIVSQHDYPNHDKSYWNDGVTIGLADIRLSKQPSLAGIKHGNRLEQIIARSQWQDSWQEALLLDCDGHVVEATQSNVFLVKEGRLITPSLDTSGVAGVMRQCVINEAKNDGFNVSIQSLNVDDVVQADEVFLTNSVVGIWPVKAFNQTKYNGFKITSKLLKNIINNEFIPNF